MINDIINGIAVKLNKVFGSGYKIYVDDVEQGLQEPCFLIIDVNTANSRQLGTREKRDTIYDIHYFPKGGREEIREVEQKLLDNFSTIELINGGIVHGFNIHTEVSDNVLHFFVNYNLTVCEEKAVGDLMETLETNGTVKK